MPLVTPTYLIDTGNQLWALVCTSPGPAADSANWMFVDSLRYNWIYYQITQHLDGF